MAIYYSVAKQAMSLGPYANTNRYYAHIQMSNKVSLDQFAEHMSEHDSKYNKGDIYAVLTMAIRCIKEMALNGTAVALGDLGTFYPKIGKQTSTASAADFSAANIGKVSLRWKPGDSVKNFRSEATLNPIVTRANQSLVLAAQTAGQTSMSLYYGGSDDDDNGGGNSGGGNSGGGEGE